MTQPKGPQTTAEAERLADQILERQRREAEAELQRLRKENAELNHQRRN